MAVAPISDGRVLEETDAEREARIRYERALIEKGEAEIEAGLGLDWDLVEAWLDELEQNPDAPLPIPSQRTADR
jgi:predicted transcriptional regulator